MASGMNTQDEDVEDLPICSNPWADSHASSRRFEERMALKTILEEDGGGTGNLNAPAAGPES